jgi:hypothetical protein
VVGGGGPEEKSKHIDRRQYLEYLFKFPQDEQDYQKLTECLAYMKDQV